MMVVHVKRAGLTLCESTRLVKGAPFPVGHYFVEYDDTPAFAPEDAAPCSDCARELLALRECPVMLDDRDDDRELGRLPWIGDRIMSDGEKMVWAAAFAGELTRRLLAAQPWPALSPGDVNTSALVATRAVHALRFGVNIADVSPEGDAMWLAMVGMNRSPDGKLYP